MPIPRLKNYPTEGAMTIADGTTHEIVLGKNSANFLRVASATASFRIRIDDTYELIVSAGKKFDSLPNKFSKIEVLNNSGGNLTFLLEIGTGNITSDEVVLSGTSNVADAAVLAAVEAMDTNIQAALEEVETELNDQMTLEINDQDKRVALSTLTGASYAEVTGTNSTVVSAVTNANGIIIRRCGAMSGGTATASVEVDDNYVLRVGGVSGSNGTVIDRDIFVPAGVTLKLAASASPAQAWVWYEVL